MASLALGVVGAFAASAVGLPPQLGFVVGAYVGGFFEEGPHTEGPRLNDKSIQASTYGIPIPIVRGTARIAGNIIWAQPLREVPVDEDLSGKGGPSATATTYSYYGTFAVSLCANEISAVRKIWADGKLIYDASDGNSGPLGISPSEAFSQHININDVALPLTVYLGTETQLADSTMEAYDGVGNVPAYRGQAYVMFTDFPLERFGNRIPNLSFEVVEVGTVADQVTVYTPIANMRGFAVYNPLLNEVWQELKQTVATDPYIVRLNADTGTVIGYIAGTHFMAVPGTYNLWRPVYDPMDRAVFVMSTSAAAGRLAAIDAASGAEIVNVAATQYYSDIYINPITGELWVYNSGLRYLVNLHKITGTIIKSISLGFYFGSMVFDDYLGAGWIVEPNIFSTVNTLHMLDVVGLTVTPAYVASGPISNLAYDSLRRLLLLNVSSGTSVERFDVISATYVDTITITHTPPAYDYYSFLYDAQRDLILVAAYATGSGTLYANYALDGSAYKTVPSTDLGNFLMSGHNAVLMTGGASSELTDWDMVKVRFDVVTQGSVLLSDVVENICVRAGLETIDVNVTELTDEVLGYVMTRQGSAGACVQQLSTGFLFDGVESDDVVKFVKRGRASAVTIAEDDLAAHDYGSGAPDILTKTRAQDIELPTKLNVIYEARALDYAQGTQASERLAGAAPTSAQIMSIEAPIVMADDYAKSLADALMFNAWTARTRYQFATSLKFAEYEPTDVVTVVDKILRITRKDEAGGLIKFEGVADDAAVYTQDSVGVTGRDPAQTIESLAVSFFVPMDTALLRDVDDAPGFYAAAGGYTSGWTGEVLYKSSDGGASYTSVKAFATAASVGVATGALGDFHGGNVFDELNTLTVAMWAGATLTSSTHLGLLNGANAAALESGGYWEILQYRTATLNADGTYTLSGLLRGRRGSDYAMSGHAAGDQFVALDTISIGNIAHASAEIGLARLYKPVTIGDTLQATSSQSFTSNAVRLEPLSPVHVGGGRNAAGDVTINWVRRGRLGGEWRDGVDVPLGEDSELYDVEIYDSSYTTLKRTVSSLSSATTTYTAAQQTTDFGGTQSTVYVKVYQLSTLAGRGFAATASV